MSEEIKCIKYPKIPSFETFSLDMKYKFSYTGKDAEGNTVYDFTKKLPIVLFVGTVKLHGTNGSVRFDNKNGFLVQSRENIITVEEDNATFASFVSERKGVFLEIIDKYVYSFGINLNTHSIVIYGEFAGKGIQKNTAINKLDKSFYVFNVRVKPIEQEMKGYSKWLPIEFCGSVENRIYNMSMFQKYHKLIDFNNPSEVIPYLEKVTDKVDKNCPIGEHFDVDGFGEGIVWKGYYSGDYFMFKTKGESHKAKRKEPKVRIPLSPEKVKSMEEFVDKYVTEEQVKKGIDSVKGSVTIRNLGDVIQWVIKDVIIEQKYVIEKSNFTTKEVNSRVISRIKDIFKNYLNSI